MAKLPVAIAESSLDDLRAVLCSQPGRLFAILDACDEPRVPMKVQELGDRGISLYRGWAEEQWSEIAPYLVEVDLPVLDWIVESLWNDPWGVFALAPTDLSGLRRHFRRFLLFEGPEGKEFYFRFYDPRVLGDFFACCSRGEAAEFFGPVDRFLVAEDGERLTEFKLAEVAGKEAVWATSVGKGNRKVRPELTAAMARRRRSQFQTRLQEHLQACLAEKELVAAPHELAEQVEIGVMRAKRYELRRECDVARYVEVLCTLAGGFDDRPDAARVQSFLYDRRIQPHERLDRLTEWARSPEGEQYLSEHRRTGIRPRADRAAPSSQRSRERR